MAELSKIKLPNNVTYDLRDSLVGDLSDLETTNKTTIVSAINEVNTNTNAVNTNVGNLSSLTTTNKGNAVAAINEVLDDVKHGVANNLIPYPYLSTSHTSRGITFTVNTDGSVSYSGTPSVSYNPFIELKESVLLKAGTYTLSNDSDDIYGSLNLWFYDDEACATNYTGTYTGLIKNSSSQVYVMTTRTGSGPNANNNLCGYDKTFTINSDAYVKVQVRTVNNTITTAISGTIYPMLEKGTVAHDYVPYNDSLGGIRRDIGDLADLETTATSDLVSAINEVNAETDIIDKLNAVIVTTPEFSTLPQTFTDAQLTFENGDHITPDLVANRYDFELGDETAKNSEWTVSTDVEGQITISGEISKPTTLKIWMRYKSVSPASGVVSEIGFHAIEKIKLTDITALPVTITGLTGVTAWHEGLVDKICGGVTPSSSMGSDWTYVCGDGSITVNGTFSGSNLTTIDLTIGIPDNKTSSSPVINTIKLLPSSISWTVIKTIS